MPARRPVYAAPLVVTFASAVAIPLALQWGEPILALYFLFWVFASSALAFVEWRQLLPGLVAAAEVVGVLLLLSGASLVFKASTAVMMAFLAYLLYHTLTRRS